MEAVRVHDKGVVRMVFVGAFWSVLSGVGVKIISFLGQVVLAWYLIPEDFGLAAMATGGATSTTDALGGTVAFHIDARDDHFLNKGKSGFIHGCTTGNDQFGRFMGSCQ